MNTRRFCKFGQGCIFFYNPPRGEESNGLRTREESQRRVKKKGKGLGLGSSAVKFLKYI